MNRREKNEAVAKTAQAETAPEPASPGVAATEQAPSGPAGGDASVPSDKATTPLLRQVKPEGIPAQLRPAGQRGPGRGLGGAGQRQAPQAAPRPAPASGPAPVVKVRPAAPTPGRQPESPPAAEAAATSAPAPVVKVRPAAAPTGREPPSPPVVVAAQAAVPEPAIKVSPAATPAPGREPPRKPPPTPAPATAPAADPAPAAKPAPSRGPVREAAATPPTVQIRPVAEPATLRRRHWGLLASFVLAVLLPIIAAAVYLWMVAADQYASTVGFTVQRDDGANAAQLLGGLAQLAGAGGSTEADILYEFIQSQEIVEAINKRVDLVGMYSSQWPNDPVFALWPDATIEDLLWFWKRVVRISYDQNTRLIELRVLGFSPEDARRVARAIVDESQKMINELNAASRQDLMRYAKEDLEQAVSRLKEAREAMTTFRSATQIVDPQADIQGRMGVLNNLQQELAQALIEHDLLLDSAKPKDPRLVQAQRRIQVIRDRIIAERQNLSSDADGIGGIPEDYPRLISEFESLSVDREYAEETYRAAMAAMDMARSGASRQTLYLAAFIRPTLPESAEFPRRWVLIGLLALFLTLAWGILALVYYSIRDRQ